MYQGLGEAFMRWHLRLEEAPASSLGDLLAPESLVSETSIEGVRVTSGHTDTTNSVWPARADAVPVQSQGSSSAPFIGTGLVIVHISMLFRAFKWFLMDAQIQAWSLTL